MRKKKTTNEFKEDVYKLTSNEYTVLGEYIGCKKKILMKHNICGHEWEVLAENFLQGSRCPKCAGNIKKDSNIFKKDVYEQVGSEYTVLGEYISAIDKILMKHNICGHEWEVTPHNFLQGSRCPKCSKKLKKTTEEFKKEVFNLVGNEYTVLGEYINSYTKILMKHNKCGHEWEVVPSSFLQGHRCPKCSKNRMKLNLNKDAKIFREKRKEKNNKSRKYANNLGQRWTFEDIYLLEKYIEEGKNTKEIAQLLGRTIESTYKAKMKFLKEKEK